MLVLREVAAAGKEDLCRARQGVHLRRVYRPVRTDHDRGGPGARPSAGIQGNPLQERHAEVDIPEARRVRGRAGTVEEGTERGGVQPLQAHHVQPDAVARCGASEGQHSHDGAGRLRQDASRPDSRQGPGRSLRDRGRDLADRGGIRRGGRGEHPPETDTGRGIRYREGSTGHHLYRRVRQDLAEES